MLNYRENLKPRLRTIIDEFFKVGFAYDPEHDRKILEKLFDFLREEDSLRAFDDDLNVRIARALVHYIEASEIYLAEANPKKVYPYMKSFLTRMLATEPKEWHYQELRLVIASLQLTETPEQALELASMANERIIEFQLVRTTENLEACLAMNMCARLLTAKFFDTDANVDVVAKFSNLFNRLEDLAEENLDSEFVMMCLYVTKIRKAVLTADTHVWTMCEELVPRYGEKFANVMDHEVKFYYSIGAFN